MDLDAWINEPPSESEDESVVSETHYDNKGLFYENSENSYNSNSHPNEASNYQKTRNYVEPTADELEQQRESRKQSEKMNPFYLKDTKKSKTTPKVLMNIRIER